MKFESSEAYLMKLRKTSAEVVNSEVNFFSKMWF